MMIPTIHLNGTSEQNLLDELAAAWKAVDEAMDVVRQVTVHGRDYYVQGPHAYSVARKEMDDRLTKLRDVRDDMIHLHAGIKKQGDEKRRQQAR